MHHVSLTPFGQQPVSAVALAHLRHDPQTTTLPPALPRKDKWSILNDLCTARAAFGLTDRDLSVLHALLSFHPARELDEAAALVVFPSNATLSDRAHGMAESTLRRHLRALIEAGLICRQDSPNGKRYARRSAAGAPAQAFGFDLRPLLRRAGEIACAAAAATERAETTRRARETFVLRLRDATKLLALGRASGLPGDWEALERRLLPLRAALRRKMEAGALLILADQTADILHALCALHDLGAENLTASAAHSGCHLTESQKDLSDSELCEETVQTPGGAAEPALPLILVLKACPDLLPYAQGCLSSWRDLVATAARLCGMMGISAAAWRNACQAMGPETAAITVCALLQRFRHIANPGGYLRALTAKAAAGRFSPGPLIRALLRQGLQGSES